jgi:Glycosyl transferase family 2
VTTLTAPGRHRDRGLVLPRPPADAERESYAWRALPFLTIALFISSLSIVLAQALMEIRNAPILPIAAALFAVYTFIYLVYQLVSLPVNFTGRSFDLAAHDALVSSWRPECYPDVDIYLPICSEPLPVLRNTWLGVAELIDGYPGSVEAFVLDDGDDDDAALVARSFGFTYVRRPVHEYKKAGNLNYAFMRTSGEHIVVFDADFRPRADFLDETLPYMDNPAIGLVQTPQFFRASPRQTWVERAAGATLEVFYRAVQVSRDRFGSALCVGSNCVYRRAALAPNGGFTVIPYAEDSHTGLDARRYGYELTYVPVPLAAGICPGNLDAFMRQLPAVDPAHVVRSHAVEVPAAVRRRLAVELHHRPADPDPAALPDRAAGLPAGRDSAAQRAAARSGDHHRDGALPPVAQHPLLAAGLAAVSRGRLGTDPRPVGLLARQGHVLAANARAGRYSPPVLAGGCPLERHAGAGVARPRRLAH